MKNKLPETALHSHGIRKRDLLYLFGAPLYLLIGTLRHELAHAVVALLEGVTIKSFVFWPSFFRGKFCWGYVLMKGERDWLVIAAPYFLDFLCVMIVLIILWRFSSRSHFLWANLVIIGMVSPFVNSAYQYIRSFVGNRGDVYSMKGELPDALIHIYFIVTILIYAAVLYLALRGNRHEKVDTNSKPESINM